MVNEMSAAKSAGRRETCALSDHPCTNLIPELSQLAFARGAALLYVFSDSRRSSSGDAGQVVRSRATEDKTQITGASHVFKLLSSPIHLRHRRVCCL